MSKTMEFATGGKERGRKRRESIVNESIAKITIPRVAMKNDDEWYTLESMVRFKLLKELTEDECSSTKTEYFKLTFDDLREAKTPEEFGKALEIGYNNQGERSWDEDFAFWDEDKEKPNFSYKELK